MKLVKIFVNTGPSTEALDKICVFQAEDGIRDLYVTGVQTCALPISARSQANGGRHGSGCGGSPDLLRDVAGQHGRRHYPCADCQANAATLPAAGNNSGGRSRDGELDAFENSDPPVRYIVGV